MKQFDPILDIGTLFETSAGSAADFPIDDDVVVGGVVAESGASTAGAVTFASLSLAKCPQHRSNLIRVPLELLADAYTAFADLIQPVLARRLARSVAATAVAQLISDADVATTTASPTAITPAEILDLMGALDPAHSQVGSFLMNESVLTLLKKQTTYPNMIGTDSEGRTTIFQKPVYSSPSMANATAAEKPVAYGNFSRFYIRSVAGSLLLKNYPERFAEYAQTAFEAFWRAQAKLATSTNTPRAIRLLQMHA